MLRVLLGAPSLLRAFTAPCNIYFILCSFFSYLFRFLLFLFFRFVLSFFVSFPFCTLYFVYVFIFCFHSAFVSVFSQFCFALFIRLLVVFYLLSSHVSLHHFRFTVFASNRLSLVSIFCLSLCVVASLSRLFFFVRFV